MKKTTVGFAMTGSYCTFEKNLAQMEELVRRGYEVLPILSYNAGELDTRFMTAEHLRERRAVVLNLESTNKEIARRLLDFLSGVAYAQEGKIKKVALQTYIVTPYNVDIMGDLIDELENNGLYF